LSPRGDSRLDQGEFFEGEFTHVRHWGIVFSARGAARNESNVRYNSGTDQRVAYDAVAESYFFSEVFA
jgi:hypothetical protein